jgi:hypothetical protein
MVIAYRETPEDRALTNPYRIYNGRKIDVRWSGGWLTPEGTYYPIDYRNGITHETIAEEQCKRTIGSGSITSTPPVIRLFSISGWMRITYLDFSSFCVELKGSPGDGVLVNLQRILSFNREGVCQYGSDRATALLRFAKNYKEYDSYFINNTQHDTYLKFVASIRTGGFDPAHSS